MKKILAVLLLAGVVASAQAHEGWRHGGGHYVYRGGGWGWVAPVVVGGVIGYELSRPPVYVPPAPVIVQQQAPVVVQGQNCSPWTQIQNPDGSVTTTRTCQ